MTSAVIAGASERSIMAQTGHKSVQMVRATSKTAVCFERTARASWARRISGGSVLGWQVLAVSVQQPKLAALRCCCQPAQSYTVPRNFSIRSLLYKRRSGIFAYCGIVKAVLLQDSDFATCTSRDANGGTARVISRKGILGTMHLSRLQDTAWAERRGVLTLLRVLV